MKKFEHKMQMLQQCLALNKEKIRSEYSQLQAKLVQDLTSPKVIGGAFLLGFTATYRGRAKQRILNYTKKHLLQTLLPLAAFPWLHRFWRAVPVVSALILHKRKQKKHY